jgi:uncharacterized protein (TIGR03083 family)
MEGIGAAYAEGRERIVSLLRDHGLDRADAPVPACPEWTVKDVAAHLSGICADVLAGNVAGVATDPWTAAQVEARADRTLADVLDEWEKIAPEVEAMGDLFPDPMGAQWVFDQWTHEHDLRHALGVPGGRDTTSTRIAFGFLLDAFDAGWKETGVPALRLVAGDQERVLGTGEPTATVRADRFDLLRAFAGRRSAAQIRAFDWDGDPEPWVPHFEGGPFTMRADDLAE